MITFTWNSGYEGQPDNSLARNMIDNELRKMRRGVRERLEREHNFGPYAEKDDGSHRPGRTTVLLSGDATTRDNLTNVQEGALYFLNDGGTKELYIYTSGSWEKATNVDHGAYNNLDVDSHEQYLKKDLDDIMDNALGMGGNEIEISSVPSDGHDGYLVYGNHEGLVHPTLGNGDAILDDAIGSAHLVIDQYSVSGSLESGTGIDIMVRSDNPFIFFPNFYASVRYMKVTGVPGSLYPGWHLYNNSLVSASYRVNWEELRNSHDVRVGPGRTG